MSAVRDAYTAIRGLGKFVQAFAALDAALAECADLDAVKSELTGAVAKLRKERDEEAAKLASARAETLRVESATIAKTDRAIADAGREAARIEQAAAERARAAEESAAQRVLALDAECADLSRRAVGLRDECTKLIAARDHIAGEISALKSRLKPLVS